MLLSAPRSLLLLPSEAPAEAARTLALLRAAAQRLQVPAVSLNSANWRVGLATGRNQLVAACPLGDADLKALPAGTTVFLVIRSEEHTSELQSLLRISYAIFCLKKENELHAPT